MAKAITLKPLKGIYMKYALAAQGFINSDINHNKKVIIEFMKELSTKADMIIFGEAFLQGFYALDFKSEKDLDLALSIDDPIIKEIKKAAKDYNIGVSFGFIERDKDKIYSSQLTIDKSGEIINLFRRVSPGWKEAFSNERYLEGHGFYSFTIDGQKIVIGLCGDLRFEENIEKVKELNPDIVWWPVYTDYNYKNWNDEIKYEYCIQASKICKNTLYVNSYCLDKASEDEIAKGGAAYFYDGIIKKEIPSGEEGILLIEIDSDEGKFDGK